MKFYATTVLLLLLSFSTFAQNAYEIKITLKPFKNSSVYLGHYYGKQLPIIDSVKLDEKSEGVFKGAKKLGGGIYLVGYPDRTRNFEILIDKNQKFSIIADTANISKMTFVGSPENVAFKEYQEYMVGKGRAMETLNNQRSQVTDSKDSIKLAAQMGVLNKSIRDYRSGVIAKSPTSLLALLLTAMKEPDIPQNHPDAKKDSQFAYHYFKNHYWDGINFYDDRLARTPFFEGRIDKYFDQLVYPAADSVIKEIDWMMGFASVSEDMQKFLLLKFINRYLNQKYMWEDAVFVHLFDKYVSQKTYPWLTEQGKKMITDRAYSLMANITGTPAAEIELPDSTGKKTTLYSLQSPYTLVAIWDPTCSHCKEMLPKLDSMYNARWKGMGLKIFALAKETDGTKKTWTSFISEHKLKDWVHVYYSKADDKARVDAGIPGYSQLYDVQSFPTLYLLDKDKRIIAKKVTDAQVDEILALKTKNN
ncbi:MAG TPA: thioredoxin-like domain-containing protein [Chitinophagaceae bacterium]|nr:thioredoxin-like domain-containing protein [Chitinophagaceae bacterium]